MAEAAVIEEVLEVRMVLLPQAVLVVRDREVHDSNNEEDRRPLPVHAEDRLRHPEHVVHRHPDGYPVAHRVLPIL
jgi:hypothetical protein